MRSTNGNDSLKPLIRRWFSSGLRGGTEALGGFTQLVREQVAEVLVITI